MKTNKLISTGLLMMAALLFAACDKENMRSAVEKTPVDESSGLLLSLTTSIEDFTDKETGTRASENGTTFSFQGGDVIGVFGVKNGRIVCNNLRFSTSNGSTWTGREIYHESGTTYFAYHPYESEMSNKTSLAAIQSDFESRLNNNPDQSNQSNYMNYCKLLVSTSGSVSPSNDKLSFTFKHALAMVEVVLPEKLEGVMRAKINIFDIYSPSSITTTFSLGGSSSFYNVSDKTYRRVVKPGTPINFKATLCNRFDYTDNSSLSAGNYKKLTLGTVDTNIQVGDFVYGGNGGKLSFFPGSTTAEAPDKANCIGVVATINSLFGNNGTVAAKNNIVDVHYTQRDDAASTYSPKAPGGYNWRLQNNAELLYLCSGTTESGNGTSMRDKLDPYFVKAGGEKWHIDGFDAWYWTSEWTAGGVKNPYCVAFSTGVLTYHSSHDFNVRPSFSF